MWRYQHLGQYNTYAEYLTDTDTDTKNGQYFGPISIDTFIFISLR